MPARDSRPSFNTGEISDEADARFDLSKFSSACEVLENFMPMPTGGARKRGGFIHAAETKNQGTSQGRLIPFRFSTGTNFMCLFEAGSIRFFSNQAQVETGGSAYEITNPYSESQLFDLHYTQINDVVYIVHPDVAPYKLSRFDDTDWTFEEVEWKVPPYLSQNLYTGLTMYPSAVTGNSITLTADADAWAHPTTYIKGKSAVIESSTLYRCVANHSTTATFADDLADGYWEEYEVFTTDNIDGYFQISQPRTDFYSEISDLNAGAATQQSDWIKVQGTVNLFTSSTWDGDLELERSFDGGATSDVILAWSSSEDFNGETSINFVDSVSLRWSWVRSAVPSPLPSASARAVVEPVDLTIEGRVKVTGVTSNIVATVDVLDDFEAFGVGNKSYNWSEGAWSSRRGFPETVALHEQRLCFGGTATSAQTIWISGSGDYENFRFGTNASDPFTVTLGSSSFNGIQWMQSKKDLMVGTTGGEFALTPATDSVPFSPNNVSIVNDTNFGSDNIQPVLLNEALMYVARANSAVMELAYSYSADKYVSPELTLLASHIVKSGVTQIDVQRGRWATMWAVTGDGFLGGMTYERSQDIVAWFRATTTTGDTIESLGTVYGAGDDELWVIVKRAKGDGSGYTRSVEYLDFGAWIAQDDRDTAASAFLDCAVVYDSTSTTTVTIPSFLVGRTLKVVLDGSVEEDIVPTSTTVTLVTAASKVVLGLAYEAKIQPTRPEVQLNNGMSAASRKRIASVSAKVKDSGYFYIYDQADTGRTRPVLFTQHTTGEDVTAPPDLITATIRDSICSDWDEEPGYLLLSDSPLPCTILGLTHEFAIGQRS